MTSSAPAYHGYEFLHPLKELSRGRFGSGLLLVYDAKKCLHVSAKRVSKRNEESFERQVALHMRASSHFNVVRFLGLLPSSTSCFQYAIEYVPDGDLRQLVVSDIGLPDEPSKYIFRQLQLCLDYLHNDLGIVHGAVRPDHVLIASANRCCVKLTNFSNAHMIGSSVKMNRKDSGSRSQPWKKQLNRLKSFLIQRTTSLKVTPGSRFRSTRRSVDGESSKQTAEDCREVAKLRHRRSSVTSGRSSPKSAKDVDVHEFTIEDYIREIDAEVFSQAFTAPELVNATRYVASPAADNWSLVMLAIFCVTGNTPWENAAVDNRKYTAFLHSAQRSKSFTPNLNERGKDHTSNGIATIRSRSLSSLVESIKKRTTPERALSPAFEKKITKILKQPTVKRVPLQFCKDFFACKWSFNNGKKIYYSKCEFACDWMKEQLQKSW